MRKLALGLGVVLLAGGCTDRRITSPYVDSFDRSEVGADYANTGGPYRIEGGRLVYSNAHNHPLWLKRRLPEDVRIEFDCTSYSPAGDLKVEAFGDGKSFESDEAVRKDLIYTASGYVFIFGGWHNSRSVLVKQNEHAWQFERGVPMRLLPRVEVGRSYHWAIVRKGGHIEWSIDGQPFLSYDDTAPLRGEGHDCFGFTGWESSVAFDNLRIEPL